MIRLVSSTDIVNVFLSRDKTGFYCKDNMQQRYHSNQIFCCTSKSTQYGVDVFRVACDWLELMCVCALLIFERCFLLQKQ